MVRISTVANGIKCGCRCPDPRCDEPLIAKTRHPTAPHFSHRANTGCNGGGLETVLHLLAKEIIAEQKQLFIPDQYASFAERKVLLRSGRVVEFDNVSAESREFGRITPLQPI